MTVSNITKNVRAILDQLPVGVQLVVVGKGRPVEQLNEAVAAGALIIGENYVQEAIAANAVIGDRVKWHFIGHLQKNKIQHAVRLFDVIETLDSIEAAVEINKRCGQINKTMTVLIEVNSGRESEKSGVMPEDVRPLLEKMSLFPNIRIQGLMTMGPVTVTSEDSRRYFHLTRQLFEQIKSTRITNVEMQWLSMGMSDSYRVAIEEGANLVRIGRGIFNF